MTDTAPPGPVAHKTPPRWLLPFSRQFGCPEGLLGRVALKSMAKANRAVNTWVLDLLDVDAQTDVLDVGCGPGVAVELASQRAGTAAGVDVSDAAVKAARARNPDSEIECAPADALPFADGAFTAVMSVNSMGFWPDPEAGVREIHRVLAAGGRVALALRMKAEDAKATDRRAYGSTTEQIEKVANLLRHVGFSEVTEHRGEHGGEARTTVVGTRK